jgi:hypothetical protein
MQRINRTVWIAACATVAGACSHSVKVQTTSAPDANIGALRTFRILATPERRANAPQLSAQDPMLDNSITNRELRAALASALESRGYRSDAQNPDFVVAFYAGERAKFDTTYWNPDPRFYRYGYLGFRDRWAWPYYGFGTTPAYAEIRESTQSTVIVDVIDARTRELLWRGQGSAEVSTDPTAYTEKLRKEARKIIDKLPRGASQ